MGFLFNRSSSICKNNPDDDIEDFKSLFEIKALDDLDPWEEEEQEIFGHPSVSSSDSASQNQESVDLQDCSVSDGDNPESNNSSDNDSSVAQPVPNESVQSVCEPLQVQNSASEEQPEDLDGKTTCQIVSTHEKKVVSWNNKGVALSRLGKYNEAIEAYDEALRINPDYTSAWNNKGVVLSRLGKYPEAIEAFDRALRIRQPNRS